MLKTLLTDTGGNVQKASLSFDHRNQAERIGAQGEYDVSSCLSDLDREEYEVFNDLLLKDGGYTSQIDHLIISPYGIFVIETKNIHGNIYGNENSEFWKQYLPDTGFLRYGFTQEHEFRNPLRQNAGHIRCLRKLIFGKDIPIHGIVTFPNDSELKVTAGQPVLHMRRVVHHIKGYQDTVLTPEQVRFYRRRLLDVISLTESDREQHLENIHLKQEARRKAVYSRRCPLCGGSLVLRHGRYGEFYGCSNYPECTYTLRERKESPSEKF